ncbi:hypothetical protein LAZ67_13001047 [Cordylochernes scorpioides]|uniref:Mos1 transposase HTH domain-containing protein n=1 Tax=Cordylochernes scorpioides TaxID=51811 RepID=A0ABY6L3Y5_9ARAC|nr:hypothetical protein LAZ67_13001047 [Cordylochernes scorpioides]
MFSLKEVLSQDGQRELKMGICGETLALMNEAYEDEKLPRTQVYFWYKRFKDGRNKRRWPLTSTTDRNIRQVRDLIVADRKITIDNISEILGISYGSCQKIIGGHSNMKKRCGYFVPRNLTDQQKETILSICKDLIETANNDTDIFNNNIW